jgi:SAM-dependent methyltransferase
MTAVGLSMDTARWFGDADPDEVEALAALPGPVLDVGCGPGRHLAALARLGVPAMGIDVAEVAVRAAAAKAIRVLRRSVFDPLPMEGSWGSAVLLDGNIGIGGDPVALLHRLRGLLRPAGLVLVETEGAGVGVLRIRAEHEHAWWADGDGRFPWARVGCGAIGPLAARVGMRRTGSWRRAGRWFSLLERP